MNTDSARAKTVRSRVRALALFVMGGLLGMAAASATEALQPPQRLVGVQGVRLGVNSKPAVDRLLQQGWRRTHSVNQDVSLQNKSQLLVIAHDARGRVIRVTYTDVPSGPVGGGMLFEPKAVRTSLIERYGTPALDSSNQGGHVWELHWTESALQYPSGRRHSMSDQAAYARHAGPKLNARIAQSSVRMTFEWLAFSRQSKAEEAQAQQQARDNAPRKKLSLGE
jgi:hypothetical protein